MPQAYPNPTTTPLSALFRDPTVRAAFERAERDLGQAFAVPADRPRNLNGGAVETRELIDA